MCGIFGYLSKKYAITHNDLKEATNSLSHRGPDGFGTYLNENHSVALGHRRLSVLDPSEYAAQPMWSNDKRYVIVFNGEIYNFVDLRNSLVKEFNIKFRSTGDTEVILNAFIYYGQNFTELLNGMFSIAIYDTKLDEVWLFRDRIGIKPLYLYQDDYIIAFSSELKAFKKLKLLKFKLDKQALFSYFNLGYIPAPLSIWQNISKVRPGEQVLIDSDRKVFKNKYWRQEDQIAEDSIKNEKRAKELLHDKLRKSVKRRLISDVPLGTFLSGGIDSSLVSAIAAEQSSSRIKTFNIGFESSKHDESDYARAVASQLGTDHHTFRLSNDEMYHTFQNYLDWFDEPFADSSAFPTYAVSKLARSQVTVALTGDGGDELGLGYGSYTWADRLSHPFIFRSRFAISNLMNLIPSSRWKRASKVFRIPKADDFYTHIFSQEQYLFSSAEVYSLINEKTFTAIENTNINKLKRLLTPKEQFSLMDLKYYLPDDLLVKVDRTSMASGLECRVPLLDHEVVSLMLNIDEGLKMGSLGSKHIFKSILFDYIPATYFNRPKQGFSIPLKEWLKNELKGTLLDSVSTLSDQEWINSDYLNKIFSEWDTGNDLAYNRIWQLLVLGNWLKKFQ
ncbi:MAG: asparagine synthase (glutamine-hydrolyzing) [Bacteroidota bacterium]